MPKAPFAAVVTAIAVVLQAGTAMAAESVELPTRQAGKWKLHTEMDEGRGPIKQTLTMCITDEMEKATAATAATEHKSNCARYDVKRDGAQTIVEAECAYAVDKVTSRTEMSGDFQKTFDVKIATTTITTPPSGNPLQRQRKINQTGEYFGADCGDLKPGEALTEDGNRVMVQ